QQHAEREQTLQKEREQAATLKSDTDALWGELEQAGNNLEAERTTSAGLRQEAGGIRASLVAGAPGRPTSAGLRQELEDLRASLEAERQGGLELRGQREELEGVLQNERARA